MTRQFGRTTIKLGLFLLFGVAVIFAGRAAAVTIPYRLSYWEGIRFYRWVWIWNGATAVAVVCVALWMCLASTQKEKTTGMFAEAGVLFFFFFAHPNWIHSITSAKNLCINQVREIDIAKKQWAELYSKKAGDKVDVAALGELLESKHLPVCPEGGTYRVGKVGEIPRCAITEHNLTPRQ